MKMNSVGITITIVIFCCMYISVSWGCGIPSSYWCDHRAVARECGVTQQCARQKREISQKPTNLTILYETHCAHCQTFIVNTLYPMWRKYRFDYVHYVLA